MIYSVELAQACDIVDTVERRLCCVSYNGYLIMSVALGLWWIDGEGGEGGSLYSGVYTCCSILCMPNEKYV